MDYILIIILVLALVSVAGIASVFLLGGKSPLAQHNTVAILGLCDSGKTSLYTYLQYGKLVATQTSMVENEGPFKLESNKGLEVPLNLVDVPGHEKLRFKYSEFLPITKAVLFVIDSTTVHQQIRPIAEYLYDILTHSATVKRTIPVLILCNKHDMLMALEAKAIQTTLETEINKLRSTQSASLDQTGDDAAAEVKFLGYENEEFKFEHVPNRIEFLETSLVDDEMRVALRGEIAEFVLCGK
ncbi:signal recognition particle receptor beta subunit-domain-containing protein [Polychytrium aggregatum]|uniref:signal recognition particle receptor beta subunit-domain-containing protein n=1 Tax=Polychytrium aggregatum TaxID=110093 RepID=UPI0022FEE298|nr:signal recognition particle receptor beta subunit-domain-containing protein [Polychytrium aggregatum]KAI9206724.1 signal recognition particle receptor beta subunit-domain-containing protein [Polychytrium aggregatum]